MLQLSLASCDEPETVVVRQREKQATFEGSNRPDRSLLLSKEEVQIHMMLVIPHLWAMESTQVRTDTLGDCSRVRQDVVLLTVESWNRKA